MPGLVILEIDGLGYGRLQQTIAAGYLPYLASLVADGGYRCYPWHCGLASDTPAVQAGLMYGRCDDVPGFYWFDRRRQRHCIACSPPDLRAAEALAAAGGSPPLLAGGSAYSCMLAGGASRAALTVAAVELRRPFAGGPLRRVLRSAATRPAAAVRLAREALAEAGPERRAHRPRQAEPAAAVVQYGPRRSWIASLLLSVLPRAVVTRATCLDMADGVPVIYSSLIGFDIAAHRHGPTSAAALRVLRGVDASLRAVFEARVRARRDYTVVVLSDHGMVPSLPFRALYGESFARFVARSWAECAKSGRSGGEARAPVRLGVSASPLSTRAWRRLGAAALRAATCGQIRAGDFFDLHLGEASSGAEVPVVATCGPLAQLWLRGRQRPAGVDDLEALAPGFVARLASHRGVGAVLARHDGRCVVVGPTGRLALSTQPAGDGRATTAAAGWGRHPLAAYGDPAVVSLQVGAFAATDAAGDIICLGALVEPEGGTPAPGGEPWVVSFEDQLGAHGGLGGDQDLPFLALPDTIPFDSAGVVSATQLYPLLYRLAHGR